MAIHKKTFENLDLQVDHTLNYVHNLNTTSIIPKWYDQNGYERLTADLFQIVSANEIALSINEVISGTHTLLLYYESVAEASAGRRLFELTPTYIPGDTLRIALGKVSTPTLNMTVGAMKNWLNGALNFMQKTMNLSDLVNKTTARANLGVYSTSQADALIAQKASLYQAASGGVLGVNNTSIYNPASNYNPAVLRNVKNLGMQMLYAAYVSADAGTLTTKFWDSDTITGAPTVSKLSTGTYKLTHGMNSVNYFVLPIPVGSTAPAVGPCKVNKQINDFTVTFADDTSLNDTDFDFFMFKLNAYTADE